MASLSQNKACVFLAPLADGGVFDFAPSPFMVKG